MDRNTARIMVVEDENIVALDLRHTLEDLGYTVPMVVASGEEAITQAIALRPDLILMDIHLRGAIDGITAARDITTRLNIPIVYLTAYSGKTLTNRAKTTMPYGYIIKPFEVRDLEITIDMALYKASMDRKLRESEQRFVATVKSIAEGVIVTDTTSRVVFMNRVAEQLTGWPQQEAAGLDLAEVFQIVDEATRAPIEHIGARVLRDHATIKLADHVLLIGRDRVERAIEDSLAPIQDDAGNITGVVLVFRDVTRRRQELREHQAIERKLLEVQKLESLGVLARGIAHNFNNLLMVIIGNADLALLNLPADMAAYKSIDQVAVAACRAAELTGQMLTYAGKGQYLSEPIDLNTAVVELAELLRSTIARNVELEYRLAPQLPPIVADAAQIRQVIMNLIINAGEAIDAQRGAVAIATGTRGLAQAELVCMLPGQDLPAGQYVYLSVTDTGPGMDAVTLAKIFDPFFSTKFLGRGLGLAAVLGIMRSHAGALDVWSQPGHGARFTVFFPAQVEWQNSPAVEDVAPSLPALDGTVLVIDDEEDVRVVTGRMLERAGCTVLSAADIATGIALLRAHIDSVACVLLDLIMPDTHVQAALSALLQLKPGLPIILMSGYAVQDAMSRLAGEEVAAFLQKPFSTRDLRQKVQEALGCT